MIPLFFLGVYGFIFPSLAPLPLRSNAAAVWMDTMQQLAGLRFVFEKIIPGILLF